MPTAQQRRRRALFRVAALAFVAGTVALVLLFTGELSVPLNVGNSILGLWFVLLFLFLVGGAIGTGTAAGYAPAREGVTAISVDSTLPPSSGVRFRVSAVFNVSHGGWNPVQECVVMGEAKGGSIPVGCQLRLEARAGSRSEAVVVQVVKASTGRKAPPGIRAGERGSLTLEGVPWHEEGMFGSKSLGVHRYWHLRRGDYLVSQ